MILSGHQQFLYTSGKVRHEQLSRSLWTEWNKIAIPRMNIKNPLSEPYVHCMYFSLDINNKREKGKCSD